MSLTCDRNEQLPIEISLRMDYYSSIECDLGRACPICAGMMTPVAAAVILDEQGRVLLTQRPAEDYHALKWEFPGGKIIPGESPESCLRRELEEELGIDAEIGDVFHVVNHQYPGLTILLLAYLCRMDAGKIRLHFHRAFQWVQPDDLLTFDLAEADIPIARKAAALKKTVGSESGYGEPKI